MKKRCRFVVMFLMMALPLWTAPAIAAGVTNLTITEEWDGSTVSFTATNSYFDIREFAVGNNDAKLAWVTEDTHNSQSLTYGLLAWKEEGKWYTSNNTGDRELTWLEGANGFGDYTYAFLYTSWGKSQTDYNGYLEYSMIGELTNGYRGSTQALMSPFAAYSEDSGTITGETTAVPIPGAVWLLGSGFLCLVVGRRKRCTG